MLLRDSAQWSETASAGVGENDIKVTFLFLDSRVEAIQVGEIRDIALHAKDIFAQAFDGGIELSLSTAGYDDIGAFAKEALSGGEAETGGSTGDKSDFIVEFTHND